MEDSGNKTSGFGKLIKDIRTTLFELLFILLQEEEKSVLQLGVMRIIDFFQLMAFSFSSDANFPWNTGNLFQIFQSVTSVFQIINYLPNFQWNIYLAVFYLGILLVVLVIIDIIYVIISIARKRFTLIWPLKILTMFCSLFVTALFLPLLGIKSSFNIKIELFVSIVTCKDNSTGQLVLASYPEVECWVGLHILHAAIAITVSIIFILISLIVTITFYETRTLTPNAGSKYF